MQFSVIVCSHNTRTDYLTRVFQALEQQNFDCSEWELVLIDIWPIQKMSPFIEER